MNTPRVELFDHYTTYAHCTSPKGNKIETERTRKDEALPYLVLKKGEFFIEKFNRTFKGIKIIDWQISIPVKCSECKNDEEYAHESLIKLNYIENVLTELKQFRAFFAYYFDQEINPIRTGILITEPSCHISKIKNKLGDVSYLIKIKFVTDAFVNHSNSPKKHKVKAWSKNAYFRLYRNRRFYLTKDYFEGYKIKDKLFLLKYIDYYRYYAKYN